MESHKLSVMRIPWYKKEKVWFVVMAVLSVLPFFFVKYIPSLDGPQHLYSVNLLKSLLQGDDAVHEYFRINPLIVGYWGGHFFMGLFHLFLPAYLAEKFFIVFYLMSMYFSFRYLVTSTVRKNTYLSFLIFPFALHRFFLLGYYSFSLGLVALFLFFGYWIRNENRIGYKQFIILVLLLLLLYLTHVIAFIFAGLILILMLFSGLLQDMVTGQTLKGAFIIFFRKAFFVALAALPAFILFLFYYRYVETLSGGMPEQFKSLAERLQDLIHLRLLHGFSHDLEGIPTTGMFILIGILFLYLIYRFGQGWRRLGPASSLQQFISKPANRWLLISAILFLAYCFIPDTLFSGSMVDRLGMLFLITLIIWIAQKEFPVRMQIGVMIVLMILFAYQKVLLHNSYKRWNVVIAEVEDAGKHIPQDAVFFPVNESDNWLSIHFLCYMGVDKAMISMKAPQSDGQFPVCWNPKRIPMNYVGDSLVLHGISINYTGKAPRNIRLADYVVRYNDTEVLAENPADPNLNRILRDFYTLRYSSGGGKVKVYRLSAMDEIQQLKSQHTSDSLPAMDQRKAEAGERKLSLDAYLTLLAIQDYAREKRENHDWDSNQ